MANSLTHALPYPIRNARFALQVAFRVAAGTPTDPTTPDTEKSTDGGATFSDTAEEITTGGTNGAGYLTLTGAETDNPELWVAAKSANCLTSLISLHPRNLAIVGSGTLSAGSAGGGTLGTLLAYDVTGCFIRTTGGTGGGGTGGANNQARRIITYNTSTGAFTVSPNWETTPDNTTTYDVLLPEGVTLGMLKALNPATAGRTLVVDSAGLADANMVKVGPTGSGTAQTAGDLAALINTVDDFLDTEIAAILAAVDTEVAAILVDTNELQVDWTNGGRLDLLIDSILADTNELQTDWVNGGRLDLILDARASQTSVDTVDDFLDTEIAAILAAVDTEVAAIKAKTDNLPTDPADASDVAALITLVDDFVDTEVAAIKAVTDALGATAAARLKLSAETMLPGTVDNTAFSPTTTIFEADDITEATADHFNGRIVIFTSGALQYQATDITDYALSSGRGRFTVTALTEAPANNDTFIIV